MRRPKKDTLVQESLLGKIQVWQTVKGFPYEVRMLAAPFEPLYGCSNKEDALKHMVEAEEVLWPLTFKLKLYDTGGLKLTKRALRKLIVKESPDNFDVIKKLKEYNLIGGKHGI